jgi:hypothetical protein
MRVTVAGLGAALAAALWACGPTVGDPCVTGGDCGPGRCVQGPSFPDGYCAAGCEDGGQCPNGSACLRGGFAGLGTCLRRCTSSQDCRAGYSCQPDAGVRVCLGS